MARTLCAASLVLACLAIVACAGPSGGPGGPAIATPTRLNLPAPPTPTATFTPVPLPNPLTPMPVPGKPPLTGLAPVESVEIVMRESLPVRVTAIVRGELPDGCTKIGPIEQKRDGNLITLQIATSRPVDAMCTMATVPFQLPIEINALGLPKGTYAVDANGARAEFTLAVDNVVSTIPKPATPPALISWAEAEALVLNGDVADGFQTHALEVTLKLRDGRTVMAIEPRIDMIFEVVKRCGAKCANLSIATE